MRFWANDSYVRPLGLDGRPSTETYIFYMGKYHPGAFETEGQAIDFDTVARILVEQLATQNYIMSADPLTADYILMINWGQTTPETDTEEVSYDGFGDDMDSVTFDEVPEHKKRENAKLIGASKLYDMSSYSLKKRLLEEAVVQDRYFINIFAVAIEDIRLRTKEKPQVKATWECQLSVPNAGMSEVEAFKAMAETGSSYFGKNVKDITFMKEGLKQGVVTIGEIRFLDYGDDDAASDTDVAPANISTEE
jgi:hypothetical protein